MLSRPRSPYVIGLSKSLYVFSSQGRCFISLPKFLTQTLIQTLIVLFFSLILLLEMLYRWNKFELIALGLAPFLLSASVTLGDIVNMEAETRQRSCDANTAILTSMFLEATNTINTATQKKTLSAAVWVVNRCRRLHKQFLVFSHQFLVLHRMACGLQS